MRNKKRAKQEDKTKQYKIQVSKKNKKNKNEEATTNKKGKKKKHTKLKKAILIIFAIIFLLCLIAVGIFAGIFFSDTWALTKEEIIANGNTIVLDSDGKQIALLSATAGNGNRKVVSFDEMGEFTANAYISIEDKRFYEHSGIDILRTAKATVSYLLNNTDGSSVGGGSTITQQLVKNLMNDDADSGTEGIERKIREMSRAYQLEKMLTKEEILEKYLNIIFVGGTELHGVEYGAQYYFAKSAKDLDLAESAFLAGINHAPNMYNPYDEENDNSELIKSRTLYVLQCMKEQNRISDNAEEAEKLYNEAVEKVEEGLTFKKGTIEIGEISYFVQEAVDEAAQDLAEEKDISYDEAESMIRSGGYTLYTTQNSDIQEIVVDEMDKDKYVETKTLNGKKISTQMGMTIIDFKTGKVVAMGGALGSDNGSNYNYADPLHPRQTGSSIKPLANISPGLEEKVITASTVYYDNTTTFKNGTQNWTPKNAGGYQGLCTVRKAIEVSSNIVNAKIFYNVGAQTVINYLHDFGLNTYTEEDDATGSLAIGGAFHGSTTLQMAAAYAALANGGIYIEPTFYEKLVDANGETVLEPEQETRRVISEANAYIITDILMDVVTGSQGTAGACYISGIDVAAKTGTTDYDDNTWLCGYTPYYAAATWNGYPDGSGEDYSMWNVGNARSLWANVMKSVHKDLDNARFEKPDNVVTAKVCRQSGKAATSKCSSTYTEYFVQGTVPEACNAHSAVEICEETGKLANQYCPVVEEKVYASIPEKEQNASWTTRGVSKSTAPTETCTVHTEETNKITVVNVVGKTEAEAKTLLAGLNIQVIEGHDSTQANGVVLRQSLAEGTKVDRGVSIAITVNNITTSSGGEPEGPSGGNTENPNENNTTTPGGGGTTTDPSGGNTENPGDTTTTNPNANTNVNTPTTTNPTSGT